MNKKDFLRQLEIRTPEHLKGGPFFLYSRFIERHGRDVFYPQNFHEAVEDMQSMKTSFTPKEDPSLHKKGILDFPGLSPQDIITSDFLLDKIEPWVEDLRKRIFKISQSPFNWDEAIKWIEEEANKKYTVEKKEGDLFGKKIRKLSREAEKYHIFLSTNNPSLPYIKKKNEWISRVRIPVGGFDLSQLEIETRRMAKATGFNQASLVMYVLCGIKPLLSRFRVTTSFHAHEMPNKEQILWKEIELKFRSRDLKFEELLGIYKQIKKSLTIKREIPLKEKPIRIRRIVKELGDPPRGSRGRLNKPYWEKARSLWNGRYPDEQYKDWRGIAQQYDRITRFLMNIQK